MRNVDFGKTFNIYLGVFACIFCFAPKAIALLILGLAVFVIIGYVKKQLIFAFYKTHLFLLLLYLAYLVGILFTQHPDIAGRYAENKLSFLVFPLLLSVRPKFILRIDFAILGLVLGTFIASLIGIYSGINCEQSGLSAFQCFSSSYISPIHHPSYFAMFLLIAVAGCIWAYKHKKPLFSLKWIIPYSLFSAMIFMLCFSLAGIIFLLLLTSILVLKWLNVRFGKLTFYTFLIGMPFLLIVAFAYIPKFKVEFLQTKHSVIQYFQDPSSFVKGKTGFVTGNEVRLIMWTVTTEKILENPLGVGTGNVDDHLRGRLSTYGSYKLAEANYNPHNQYLQTALEIGWIGLSILLLFLGATIQQAWKKSNWFMLILTATLIFNSLFESMLQRHSGIVFYSFWICILIVFSSSKTPHKEITE